MSQHNRTKLRQVITNQIRRINSKIEILDMWSRRISRYRLAVFAAGVAAFYFATQLTTPAITLSIVILFIGVFLWLASRHKKVDNQRQQFKIWKSIRTNHLARMDLNWDKIPDAKSVDSAGNHPYAVDLNITGNHSLLQLMDTSIYSGGREQLKKWLLDNAPDINRITERLQLVRELKPMAHFRDRLQLHAAIAKSYETEDDWNMSTLMRWLKHSSTESYTGILLLLGGLAAANITLGILNLLQILPPYYFFTLVIYLVVYSLNYDKTKNLFDDAYQIEKLLSRFSSILIYLEKFPFKKRSYLETFCARYQQEGTRPSRFLKKIIRIASAASSQKSELLWALLNLLVPWDLFFSHQLNRYKSEVREPLNQWLEQFYKLEALCSLANFAWLNPHYILAEPRDERSEPVLEATDLGHPLIPHDKKVTNDITIQENGTLLLITGSNMSGKSTFLRTLGINLCLCLSGGPVNASSFRAIPFRLFSSINVTDSLDEGLSHFYAEVKKLRLLLEELKRKDAWPLFFLVDEIFRGTNNRERLIGSTAFLKHVAGSDGVGTVSTHDLELASLENEIPQLSNWHFEETIKDGKMSFEYKLKPGPCPTTNALTIMEMEGLPVGKE